MSLTRKTEYELYCKAYFLLEHSKLEYLVLNVSLQKTFPHTGDVIFGDLVTPTIECGISHDEHLVSMIVVRRARRVSLECGRTRVRVSINRR